MRTLTDITKRSGGQGEGGHEGYRNVRVRVWDHLNLHLLSGSAKFDTLFAAKQFEFVCWASRFINEIHPEIIFRVRYVENLVYLTQM